MPKKSSIQSEASDHKRKVPKSKAVHSPQDLKPSNNNTDKSRKSHRKISNNDQDSIDKDSIENSPQNQSNKKSCISNKSRRESKSRKKAKEKDLEDFVVDDNAVESDDDDYYRPKSKKVKKNKESKHNTSTKKVHNNNNNNTFNGSKSTHKTPSLKSSYKQEISPHNNNNKSQKQNEEEKEKGDEEEEGIGKSKRKRISQRLCENDEINNQIGNDEGRIDTILIDENHEMSLDDIWVPDFVLEENIKDKSGRKKDDPDYDPSTLLITEFEFDSLTPMMQQYWKIKSEHFDQLILFKFGRWYHLFLRDAFIAHKILDTRLCFWGKMSMMYFQEQNLSKCLSKLMEHGYKLAVVEQMDFQKSKENNVIRRELTQVLTRGTYIEPSNDDYNSKFLLAIFERKLYYGIVYLDTTTHEFYIGEFKDDENRSNFRTLVYKIRPLEVIYYKEYLTESSMKILQSLSSKPQLSLIRESSKVSLEEIFNKLDEYFDQKNENYNDGKNNSILFNEEMGGYPGFLRLMKGQTQSEIHKISKKTDLPWYFAFQAIYQCTLYLESLLLAETVFKMGNFLSFDLDGDKKCTLYLDSQTIYNLELFEVNYLTSIDEGSSLFGYMNHTSTPFGRRLFKKWLLSPLIDVKAIQERQEAVDDLIKYSEIAEYFQENIGKLPDLERNINHIYNLANKKRLEASYFEDFVIIKIQEFLLFLKDLKKIEGIVEYFKDYIPKFKSKRLKQLTSFKDIHLDAFKYKRRSKNKTQEEGLFPRINDLICDLEKMITYENKIPIPVPGLNKQCDNIREKLSECKSSFNVILEKWRKYFNDYKNINFHHTSFRYQLEIPEEYVEKKKPEGFIIISKRKNYLRFHTKEIENKIMELQALEAEYKNALVPFVVDYFKKFYERNSYWLQLISCLAEIDCLCSLAKLASTMKEKCKPELILSNNKEQKVFELRQMSHPTVAKKMPNFVKNDIILQNSQDIFLITGPNMGGKSTLLRQACIAVIMAQVGSYIPSQSFKLTPIDRIFSRIGASDRINEGKSTFFIEMEETFAIVKEATNNSLVIIDELGRGTSTYDGVAIAYSVLKYIAEEIKCITLFATHYHLLIEEFRLYQNIKNYHMECEFDEHKDEVKFLYRFNQGETLNSYGISVAKMAGLNNEVIKIAKEKALFMSTEKRNISYETTMTEKFNKIIQYLLEYEVKDDKEKNKDNNDNNNNDDEWLDNMIHLIHELI